MPTPTGDLKFAVLLCKLKDVQEEPRSADWFEPFLNGTANGSVRHYWQDASLGHVTLEFDVFDWTTIPRTLDEYKADNPGRRQKIVGAFAAFPSFDLANYGGVIAVFNTEHIGDSAATAPNLILAHPGTLSTTWFTHEIGHVLGMEHSADESDRKIASWAEPGDYYHHHDIMSAMNVHSYRHPEFGASGPLCCAPFLDQRRWLNEDRIWREPDYGNPDTELDLVSLSHPEIEGYLAAEFCGLYIEYRTVDKWDQGIPKNTVLIQKSGKNSAMVLSSDPEEHVQQWLPGMSYPAARKGPPAYPPDLEDLFPGSTDRCEIDVISFDEQTHKARIRLRKIAGDKRRPLVVGPGRALGGSIGTGGGGFVILPGGQIVPIPPRDPFGGWRTVAIAAIGVAAVLIVVLAAAFLMRG